MNKFIKLLNPGEMPSAMVLLVFGVYWSIIGLTLNSQLTYPISSFAGFWLSTTTLVISCTFTYLFSSLVSYAFPEGDNDSLNRNQLIGQTAHIISWKADEKFGMARVKNPYSNITLFCKVDQGEPNIKNGEEIVIWKYDEQTRFFLVKKSIR